MSEQLTTADALQDVIHNVNENWSKRPTLNTLLEEVAEAILAARGKHEHPLRVELVQIAGICINMIRQIDAGTNDYALIKAPHCAIVICSAVGQREVRGQWFCNSHAKAAEAGEFDAYFENAR
jgi:hypothetical protein